MGQETRLRTGPSIRVSSLAGLLDNLRGKAFLVLKAPLRAARGVTILVVLASMLACSSKDGGQAPTFFPQSNEVQGWTKVSETRTFPANRLWEYIDGDADKYTQAGVHEALTAEYRFDGKIDTVVDVFVMSAASGATKVFDAQPSFGGQPAQIGDGARLYRGSLTFRKGRYFVRLVAFQDAPQVSEALIALGRSISGRLE